MQDKLIGINQEKMAFRLNCRNKLYKDLGRYDAIVEFTEIAIRDFLKQKPKNIDFDIHLQNKSEEHGVKVDAIDQSIYRTRISQSYILSVYQSAELFIHSFRHEYNDLYETNWGLDDTKENILIKTLRKVSPINRAKEVIGEHKIEIFDYYRNIRNKYSHEIIRMKKVNKALNKISKFKELIKDDYSKLNAPNDFNKINFDDFILFSRVMKEIADSLCVLVKPDFKTLIDYYRRKKFFTKFNENKKRKQNALKSHILSNFGLSGNEVDKLIDELIYN